MLMGIFKIIKALALVMLIGLVSITNARRGDLYRIYLLTIRGFVKASIRRRSRALSNP